MYRCLLFLAIVLQIPLIALPAEKFYSCEAPADIQTAINIAGSRGIEALLQKYPNDFWVRLAYIDSASGSPLLRGNGGIPSGPVQESVIERYRKESENLSEDVEAAYLYAYSLIHRNTAKSVEVLTGLTQSAPSFPRTWLSMASIYSNPAFTDSAKVRQHTEKFLALCPNTLESRVATLAQQLDRSEIVIAYAKALRERIAGKENEQTLALYQSLWQLESKLALPAEQTQYRKRLEDDLKFLEGLDKTKYRIADILLTQGYQRLGKDGAGTSADLTAYFKSQTEWRMANPQPAPAAKPEARAEYYKKQLQFANEWLDKLPNNLSVISNWFIALSSQPDSSDESLVREGNKALAAMGKSGFIPTASLEVIQVWAQRGLELDRIPALVQEVVASQHRAFSTSSAKQQSDLQGDYLNLMNEDMRWTSDTKAWGILVTAYIKNHQLDEARDVLAEWEKVLDSRRSKAKEISERQASQSREEAASERSNPTSPARSIENSILSRLPSDEANYYESCAQLAAVEDRTLDALAFYQSSLRLMYGRSVASSDLNNLENVKEADRLWKKLGGSPAAWNVWLDSIKTMTAPKIQSGPRWSGTNRAIPQFSLLDLNGKTWTLDSLKGKTTLVNVWATWCAPCRLELPFIQELYEQNKNRGDIQVITLNMDADQNLVEPFLKKNKFSFPSLFAKSFMDKFAGSIGIPMTWIVDSTGTIRNETLGYSSSSSDWVSQTMKRIENVISEGNRKLAPINR
jgi:thiol-disulfide isomerase/thioredoxin